jgi:hypothetical protein
MEESYIVGDEEVAGNPSNDDHDDDRDDEE